MFKDFHKYLSTSLKVYLFVLVIIFILKIVGLDYFGLDLKNPIMLYLEKLFSNLYVRDVYYLIELMFTQYLMISIICKDNSRKLKIITIISTPITYIFLLLISNLVEVSFISFVAQILYLLIISIICNKKYTIKRLLIRFIKVILLNLVLQLISMVTRLNYSSYVTEFIPNVILNLDYIFLLLIFQHLVIKREGDDKICIYQEEVGSSLLKKISLKNLLQRLQRNFQNNIEGFKKKTKEEKLTLIIFTILSFIWNCLTLVIVFVVAMMNDTLIECIFIVSSFWLSKTSFGQPFHFDSMIVCFIVSNLTYFILNRITTPLGISILVPIMLGVGLSYLTSKFVKKIYKPLYRGMPKDLFEETILKVTEKDSDKYKICYEFYIDKKSDLSLSYKYNYSVPGIRKIRNRINDKIKRL